MKISLPAHPAYVIHFIILCGLLMSFIPMEGDYFWMWDAVMKVRHGLCLLFVLLVIGGCLLAEGWLLKSCLAKRSPHPLWSNIYWWLFLFSFPPVLFALPFYFPHALPESVFAYTAPLAIASAGIIAVLSHKMIPHPDRFFIPLATKKNSPDTEKSAEDTAHGNS